MTFSSLIFLFAFFPISLLLYYLVPQKAKNTALVVISLLFYAWGMPKYMVLLAFSIFFNYFAGLGIARSKAADKRHAALTYMVIATVVNLLLLGFFKYDGFLIENINHLFHLSLTYTPLPLPIGISFYTFQALSYLFDIYMEKAPVQENFINFAVYVSFFPKITSGPIVQYHDMVDQLTHRSCDLVKFGEGAKLFIIGLGKKVLLADGLNTTFTAVSALPANGISTLTAWVGCITYTLVIYFDFSGYSDMAIGLAKMFGFDFAKNFDYPYISESVTEYWRRWHISLGRWFRDYVYIPLGGNRNGLAKNIRNIIIVWLLTGLWHGAAWNFIFWGGFYGALLLLEKFVLKDFLPKIPAAVKHIFTMLMVMIGWVFFFSPTLPSGLLWVGRMFGIGAPAAADAAGRYYLTQSLALIIIGAFGATPAAARIGRGISAMARGKYRLALRIVSCCLILVLSMAYMVNSTYSTFLYFKF
ncbi:MULTISPECIES: MBOAT family O-acyltransferase [Caproicibacterium]|uniref:MBOAT family protein n=1 Tax=Caproicibacterium lactatifermentans TaxID=2666138 RepID=A0A859DRP4_9FIRM|nr:MBOAT family protein [Caproicibacterium lactatifermentans]ARP50141.1 transcriptional regulator [Ruminococcaceae bacterium CPB6]MDD4808161.1 MBOAT family protein [Oscillospiraceae bacterium]QKN24135.1 MBOAT family protein [Caproicibacterium lactatifermentans]QKO30796.1 MBOAT family protein [Caproicibacterium lactatifermentans]